MLTPSQNPRISVFGHESAHPEKIAQAFGGVLETTPTHECDLAFFVIDPNTGIDANTIENWATVDQWQIPRLVLVTGLEQSHGDFDDAVLIANRVLDQLVTPFLVLHDEAGLPCALISLSDLRVLEYSTNPPTIQESEPEHKTLVGEFALEYAEAITNAGDDAFVAGLLFPAIPVWLEKGIGVDIVKKYISEITQSLQH
ncbi:unannotated protein [freshwater metagenome]|uniref:Unannotated protein n=1 Tax=freshwater metagenome TaxID=449393 RepID=A0A6J7XVI1_9ZZZZ|nr:hypothetical protein [Actinomycetota bacterium]